MSKMKLWCLLGICLTLAPSVWAHPTSFRGSVGIMGYHAPILSHNQLNYSVRHWWAVGAHHLRLPNRGSKAQATLASSNFLLKRWNGASYQGNLYAVVGGGQSEISGKQKGVGFGLLQFDIEDRNYYFLAKHWELHNSDRAEIRQSVVRFGLAPYQGSFDDIHSWLILEWQNNDFIGQQVQSDVTPFLRIFYQNLLFEIGQSFRGVTRFNYITHF